MPRIEAGQALAPYRVLDLSGVRAGPTSTAARRSGVRDMDGAFLTGGAANGEATQRTR